MSVVDCKSRTMPFEPVQHHGRLVTIVLRGLNGQCQPGEGPAEGQGRCQRPYDQIQQGRIVAPIACHNPREET